MLKRFIILLLSTLWLCSSAQAAIYYISPNAPAADTNAGTNAGAPWLTFAFALPRLFPGDILTLLDGTYTTANSGLPQINCTSGHRNGTAALPITMRAMNERLAYLSGNGTVNSLLLFTCDYWIIEGIRASGADTASSGKDVFRLYESNHNIIRRNLVQNNNRYHNTNCLINEHGDFNLFEENEVYNCHRHALMHFGASSATVPTGNILRRNYVNSRDYADIPGGYAPGDRPDEGISCYPCNSTIFENNIVERFTGGLTIQAKFNTLNNQYLGNIAMNNNFGVIFRARNDNPPLTVDDMPQNTTMRNNLVMSNVSSGAYFRANKNTQVFNMTLLANGGTAGFLADSEALHGGDGAPTIAGTNILIAGNTNSPLYIQAQSSSPFNELVVFGNGAAAVPSIPNAIYNNVSTTDPALGTCKVFIPAASPASGTGVGGADVGANILYRYQDGALTTSPLWNPTTGAFPCGAIIAGVNDIAGTSCFDVHQRLSVNFNGCTLPGAVVDTPEQFYASPTGTGNCLGAGTPCTIQTAFGLMGVDDTLNLADGTYTGDSGMINPPSNLHGTAIARITVKATNAGMVTIDGQGARLPLVLDTNSYWRIEDINIKNSSFSNVIIQNSTGTILRRVITWDANALTGSNLYVIRDSTNTFFDGFAGWGGGRHCILLDGSTDFVGLRGFLMKNNTNDTGPCVLTTGRSTGTVLGNIISTVDLNPGASTTVGNTIGPETLVGAVFTAGTTKILGSIIYSTADQAPGVQSALIDMGVPPAFIDVGDIVTTITDNILVMRRGSSVTTGMAFNQDGVKSIITTDHWTDSPVRLPGGQTTEGTAGGGEGFDSTFDGGLLNLDAETQPADGAWIEHCYIAAGTLDVGCNLWPWAMNGRIQDALIASGRAAQGGLDGAGGTDLTAFILAETDAGPLTAPIVLTWAIQPNATYGEDLTLPAVKVCVHESSTPPILQTAYATAIVVAIEDNPSAGTLSGTLSKIPTNGCAIYNDLSISNAGVAYTLAATSAALTEVESTAFTITATGVGAGAAPTIRMLQLR